MADVLQLLQTDRFQIPIGHAIRTGVAFFRQRGLLHPEGRLPARAVVIDVSKRGSRRNSCARFVPVAPT